MLGVILLKSLYNLSDEGVVLEAPSDESDSRS